MSGIREWRAASCALIAFFAAASVHAHAPPAVSRVVWSPAGDLIVLVTNRGLIFRAAPSDSWSMMCAAALGTGSVLETQSWEEPDVAYLPDGRLLAATSMGLRATADGGCSWRAVAPFESAAARALAQHPSEPNTLYLAVSSADGGSIQKTRDGGATWVQDLALARGETVTRLLFAPMAPMRLYATLELAGSGGGASAHAVLRWSDADASWKRFTIPLQAGERSTRLVAVSPRDPELLLVLATTAEGESQPDRILVSRDGGQSFSDLWSATGLRDAGFGPDGASVWIAGDEWLWRSDDAMSQLTPVGEAQLVTCVGAHAGSLYVCGHHSGFDPLNAGVGVSADGGQTFQRFMSFTEVTKPVTCEPSSETARACEADWNHWQREILVGLGGAPIEPVQGDAGVADASSRDAGAAPASSVDSGLSGGAPMRSRASAGSGCTLSHTGAAGSALFLVCGLAPVVALARRRRR
jgi:hypothetical protein